ncbi:hypothetical protein SADUNF_Sadunf11G0072100 [Salix dunnii]|uniref:Uncharacterized protein n=1 Tax=Salix dunnii TaxID=1413687 RepID=A0A835JP35_9ROSI|nr:hypothetical protein SADUNF_Sadunf11G0072100 [Salix dunnii]
MQGPRRGEAAPARPAAWRASRRQQPKTGHHHSRQQHTMAASARKPQARTRQRALHAMGSGIAGRADAGTQARQFNATPTPATALHAIHDHGAPTLCLSPASSLGAEAGGIAPLLYRLLPSPNGRNECRALRRATPDWRASRRFAAGHDKTSGRTGALNFGQLRKERHAMRSRSRGGRRAQKRGI